MKNSFFIALIIVVIASLWVLSGIFGHTEEANLEEQPKLETLNEPEKLVEVRVEDLTAQPMDDVIEVTGRTQASRDIIIRAETEGTIQSLLVEKGAFVKKGQVLVKLDVQDRAARLEEARQLLKQREIQFNASQELAEKGYNSRVRLAEKKADLESARAQLRQAQEELSNIVVKAPFAGIINDQMVELGDYVSSASDLLQIVDLNPVEVTGFLTENQIMGLEEGDKVSAVLLNGRVVDGTLSFIAAAADPQTRTFDIEVTVPNDDSSIKEGLTSKILLPFKEPKAYKISPSILSLGDDGVVGIKTVNQDNIIEFKPVRLLKDMPDYIWIGGLPDNVTVVTVGQEFVVDGQQVQPIRMTEGRP